MKTLNLNTIEIGSKVNSTNGKYYHTVQSIGKKKDLPFGDARIVVKTKCFSNTGRFVQNETIHFHLVNGHFVTNHVN